MKKNFLITLAAIAALASCKKNETPETTPFSYELVNAKINLGAANSLGPVGCIELNDDGTYVAEILADAAGYEGLDKYLQIPFERILVGIKDRKVANYMSGTYVTSAGEYRLDGLGTLSFDADMQYANYSFLDGRNYRDRTGITPGAMLPAFKAVNGQWTPCKADIRVSNLADNSCFEGSYDTLDFEGIAADVATGCVPELESYLPLFEGYRLNRMKVSQLNTFVMEYANGKKLGGYWKFDDIEGTVNKTLEDKRILSTSLTFTPALDGNRITLVIDGEVSVDNIPTYQYKISLYFCM